MRKTILTFGLLLLSVAVRASSDAINALRVHCKSGENVTILLDENPVVRFQDFDLVISTDLNVVSFSSDDAEKFTYVHVDPFSANTGILSDVVYAFDKESVKVSNLAPQTPVSIYTVDGRLVASAVTDKSGSAVLKLAAQSGSVYIVQTPSLSFKLSRP